MEPHTDLIDDYSNYQCQELVDLIYKYENHPKITRVKKNSLIKILTDLIKEYGEPENQPPPKYHVQLLLQQQQYFKQQQEQQAQQEQYAQQSNNNIDYHPYNNQISTSSPTKKKKKSKKVNNIHNKNNNNENLECSQVQYNNNGNKEFSFVPVDMKLSNSIIN